MNKVFHLLLVGYPWQSKTNLTSILKYVLSVTVPLLGEKNGRRIGRRSCIAAKNAEETKKKI